jgi:hypothetical protein
VACSAVLFLGAWIAGIAFFTRPDESPFPKEMQGLVSQHMPADFKEAVKADTERSSKWPTFRKHVLEKHPFCAYCGGTEKLQVHHINPFHLHPELELDETNVIVLCEVPETDHHLHIGHLGDFRSVGNPDVVRDCFENEKKLRAAGRWPRD